MRSLENVTAIAANVEQFLYSSKRGANRNEQGLTHHSGVGTSLLGLEEDGFFVLADRARVIGTWELLQGANKQCQPADQERKQTGL